MANHPVRLYFVTPERPMRDVIGGIMMAADNGRVQIRPAKVTDADRIFEMLTEFVTSYRPVREAFDRNFPALLDSADANLLVADDGELRGYALALRVPTLYANGDLWNLQELFVDASFRSQGIGHKLLDAVVDNARLRDAVEVTVVSRRAGPYYIKHGFVETASYFKLKLTDSPPP